jgi:tetratricopeptide (TPR) repeat protein
VYLKLVKLVHPDSVVRNGLKELKSDASAVFEALTNALKTLTDPTRKKQYLDGLQQTQAAAGEAGKSNEELAKIAFHQGKLLLNRRLFADAEGFFRRYAMLLPEDVRGQLMLGWCLYQNQNKELAARLEEARLCFAKALKLDPANADAQYYMALYFKEKGDFDQVDRYISKALELNKEHVAAQRERRLLDMRRTQRQAQPSVQDYLKEMWTKLTRKK